MVIGFQFSSFRITGTIGIDHKVVSAKPFKLLTILELQSLDPDSTAAHTKNRVIAIQRRETINFQIDTVNHEISSFINHHKISDFTLSIASTFTHDNIVTKTVEILIAKQIIAGEKITFISSATWKHSNKSPLKTLLSRSNAFSKTINGDIAIAIHRIHILIINTTATTINGIHIANICHTDNAVFNTVAYSPASGGMIHIEFTKEVYNAENTPT